MLQYIQPAPPKALSRNWLQQMELLQLGAEAATGSLARPIAAIKAPHDAIILVTYCLFDVGDASSYHHR